MPARPRASVTVENVRGVVATHRLLKGLAETKVGELEGVSGLDQIPEFDVPVYNVVLVESLRVVDAASPQLTGFRRWLERSEARTHFDSLCD